MSTPSHRRIAAVLGAGLLLVVAGCGSSADDTSDRASGGAGDQRGQSAAGGSGGRGFPGANGEVVAVSGDTAQVQSRQNGQATGQTAVTWNGRTTFTQQVDATLADVSVGSCVMVGSAEDGSVEETEIAADSVRIVSSSGDCAPGRGGPGAGSGQPPEGMPGGGPGGRPSAAPEGMPSSPPAGAARTFGGAFGKVTATSGSGFSVESVRPGQEGEQTGTVSVSVSGATTYTRQTAATAAAVKVGVCVQARGDSDETGTIAATSVQVSVKVDGACAGGFGTVRSGGPQGQES